MSETGTCISCKYADLTAGTGRCQSCSDWSNWKPKEEKMDNEKTTKIEEACVEIQLKEAREKIEEQERYIRELQLQLARKTGRVEGLEFSIRANGVSGGEV